MNTGEAELRGQNFVMPAGTSRQLDFGVEYGFSSNVPIAEVQSLLIWTFPLHPINLTFAATQASAESSATGDVSRVAPQKEV